MYVASSHYTQGTGEVRGFRTGKHLGVSESWVCDCGASNVLHKPGARSASSESLSLHRQWLRWAFILEVIFCFFFFWLKHIIWFASNYGVSFSSIESLLHPSKDIFHQVKDKCWGFGTVFEDSCPIEHGSPQKRKKVTFLKNELTYHRELSVKWMLIVCPWREGKIAYILYSYESMWAPK